VQFLTQALHLWVLLVLALAGCGGAEDTSPWSDITEPPSASQPSAMPPLEGEEGGASPEGEVEAMNSHCRASCSVVGSEGTSCPATVTGLSGTTFPGACSKACKRAKEKAAQTLPVGCTVDVCRFSACQ
jgi:hypothetical protein